MVASDPTPIRTLFLDAGGVLVFPNWNRVSAALAARGVDAPPDLLAAGDARARRRIDLAKTVGHTTDRERGWLYFNFVLDEAGVPQDARTDSALDDLQSYHREWNLWENVPADVPAALERFKGLGLQTAVVSNANGRLHVLFDRLGLSRHFDLILDSAVEGLEKPDPRLFRVAIDRLGADPDRTLHLGDFYHVDVVGARAAGLRAVLLDPADLYPDADCLRVRSLGELADRLERGDTAWQRVEGPLP